MPLYRNRNTYTQQRRIQRPASSVQPNALIQTQTPGGAETHTPEITGYPFNQLTPQTSSHPHDQPAHTTDHPNPPTSAHQPPTSPVHQSTHTKSNVLPTGKEQLIDHTHQLKHQHHRTLSQRERMLGRTRSAYEDGDAVTPSKPATTTTKQSASQYTTYLTNTPNDTPTDQLATESEMAPTFSQNHAPISMTPSHTYSTFKSI